MFVDVYTIPYLVDKPGLGMPITGELWSVDDPTLMNLDVLEGVPEQRYLRKLIDVRLHGDTPRLHEAWLYAISADWPGLQLERRQMLSCYDLGLHRAKFVAREDRDPTRYEPWGGFE